MQDLSEDELRKLWEQHRDSTDDAHAGTKSEILLALQKKKANLPDLTNLHMSKVDLCGADLTYLDLGGANFREAILIGTLFVQGDMVGTDFTQANLGGANFFDADVTEANFTKANLAKVDFTEVRAGGAVFHGADIGHGSLLMAADFSNADLSDTNLQGANLLGTELTRTNLKGADMRGVENLTCKQVQSAIIDKRTQIPTYLTIDWSSDDQYTIQIKHEE